MVVVATGGKRGVFLVVAAVAALLAVPAGNAARSGLLTCPANAHPFAQFGDNASYFGFANNGFESGTSGWSVSGAAVASGNESWGVNGDGTSSLSIGPGGTASSPRVCTALLAPDWRLFAKANSANGALRAQIVFYGLLGNVTGIVNFTSFSPSGYGSWEPTSQVPSLLSLPLATVSAQIRLTSTATNGTWQVDDVFVDPFGMRG
jgi:hypothetical protein